MHSSANSQNDSQMADWSCCPPGELQRLVEKLNVVEHCAKRKRICFCGVGATLLIIGLIVGAGSLLVSDKTNQGNLTCQQCQSHFRAYHDRLASLAQNRAAENGANGDIGSKIMGSTLAEKMKLHLTSCPRCRTRFNSQYPGLLAIHRASTPGHPVRLAWFAVSNASNAI